jgi:energy-coupling factor transport system ATP-binding protein
MDITLQQVEYRYQMGTPFERRAIYDIDLDIPHGTYLAVIGHTGSGKSTLIQHLNALLQPTKGTVTIGDTNIQAGKKERQIRQVRQKVGIVFQFPEHQLFEETVEKDICFGPMNFGVSEDEARKRARKAIELVGLSEDLLSKSPFELSGGQMRRVAIAGVLAMKPNVLVLDEPTAGLDPKGRKDIMDMFYRLHQEERLSTVLVTHSMEDAAKYADEIIIMHKGTIHKRGTPTEIFHSPEELLQLGLDVPDVVRFQYQLEKKLGIQLNPRCLSIEQLAEEIQRWMGGNGR